MKHSLQLRLSVWLCGTIAVIAVAAGVVSFLLAFQQALEGQDDQLRQMAALFDGQKAPVLPSVPGGGQFEGDPDSRVAVQWLDPANPIASQSGGALAGLPPGLTDGFHTLRLGATTWRVFVKAVAPTARIAVGQRTEVRDEMAQDSAQHTLSLFLILIPVLLVVVGALIRNMFRPLKAAALDLDRRSEHDLHEISDAGLPAEVRPFVVAINRLLSRVGQSVVAQRRFVADAAHELRSPLTALSLQAEQLGAADMSAQARERLASLRLGIRRARNLLDQLLTLARVQDLSQENIRAVPLQQVFRQVLEDLMPLVEAKDIDISVVAQQDVNVMASQNDLQMLVKNLVDNAIRYTPHGGLITVSAKNGERGAILQVVDTGPGIAPEERERVFDAFYRVLGQDEMGSGLGLSIVRNVADRLGAQIGLAYADESMSSGLRVTVVFPGAGNSTAGNVMMASAADKNA